MDFGLDVGYVILNEANYLLAELELTQALVSAKVARLLYHSNKPRTIACLERLLSELEQRKSYKHVQSLIDTYEVVLDMLNESPS